jgi:hypothetical protein
MLVTTWYTHVSPTATGNGIEPAATTDPGLTVGVAVAVAPDVTGALEAAPAGLLDDAAADVLAADVAAAEPHPASTTTAALARTARADVYLLTVMRTAQG